MLYIGQIKTYEEIGRDKFMLYDRYGESFL
jgi:hypothetical protein